MSPRVRLFLISLLLNTITTTVPIAVAVAIAITSLLPAARFKALYSHRHKLLEPSLRRF